MKEIKVNKAKIVKDSWWRSLLRLVVFFIALSFGFILGGKYFDKI